MRLVVRNSTGYFGCLRRNLERERERKRDRVRERERERDHR